MMLEIHHTTVTSAFDSSGDSLTFFTQADKSKYTPKSSIEDETNDKSIPFDLVAIVLRARAKTHERKEKNVCYFSEIKKLEIFRLTKKWHLR